jgi:hypothetical protein
MISNAELIARAARKETRLNDCEVWECLRNEYRNSNSDQIAYEYERVRSLLKELAKVDELAKKAIDASEDEREDHQERNKRTRKVV